MGQEQDSVYYDKIFSTSGKYKSSYNTSIYLNSWNLAVEWLKDDQVEQDVSILDVGCATGQFAELLKDQNFNQYKGLDFSPSAIQIAKERIPSWADSFEVADIFQTDLFQTTPYTHACIFEVLEHLNEDIQVLNLLKPKTKILASVPNFWDPAHVRVFKNADEVITRYQSVMNFVEVKEIPIAGPNVLFLFYGVKL